MSELPRAVILHNVPGRLRLRVPERRRDPGYFQRLAEALGALETVTRVSSNPRLGSVLIEHTEDAEGRIASHGVTEGLFVLDTEVNQESLAELVHRGVDVVDARLREASAGWLDLRSLGILGMTWIGAGQVFRGHSFPAGFSMFWHVTTVINHAKPRAPRPPATEPRAQPN